MVKNNSDPFGTLSIGNVVTTGATLYKSNFKRYLQVSLRATGWAIAIFISALGLAAIGGVIFGTTQSLLGIIPFGLGWLALSLYFLAKYHTDRAVICRLAYQELIDAPETVAVATSQLLPRTWGFLRLSLLLGLYMSLVAIGGYILLIIALGLVVAALVFALKLSSDSWILSFAIGGLTIGLLLLLMLVLIRYYSYWFVAELPLALESTTSANFSIRRSKQLIGSAVGRVLLIITIAFLITLPINVVSSVPSFMGQVMSNPAISPDRSTQTIGVVLIVLSVLLSIIIELFVMPFWQTIKAIVYYDLRNRKEGGDLII